MTKKYAVVGKDILDREVFYRHETGSANTVCASFTDKMSIAVDWFDEVIANTSIGIKEPEVVRIEYITEDVAAFKEAQIKVLEMKSGLSNTELAILYGQL